MDKVAALETAVQMIVDGKIERAKEVIQTEYPFKNLGSGSRNYTDKQKWGQFKRDGFIDRYSGQKLLNPGILKTIS